MSAFSEHKNTKFLINQKSESKSLLKETTFIEKEKEDEDMQEDYSIYEDKIKYAANSFNQVPYKKSLKNDVLEKEIEVIKSNVNSLYCGKEITTKDYKVIVSNWRALPWGFENKKYESVDEFEKNIDVFINKVTALINILKSDAKLYFNTDDFSHDVFTIKLEGVTNFIAEYILFEKENSETKEGIFLYFTKRMEAVAKTLKSGIDNDLYDSFAKNIKKALGGIFYSFYMNVMGFIKQKPVGRLYPSYKVIMNLRNNIFLKEKDWNILANNINKEIKESDKKLKVFLTDNFSNFILNDIAFYISTSDLYPLLKNINVLNITCNTKLFNKIMGNLSSNPQDMTELMHLEKVLVNSGIWDVDDVPSYLEEYLSVNTKIIKTTKNLNYLYREELLKYIKTPRFFWLMFFNGVCEFETNLSRSSVAEDKIQKFLYSFDLLNEVSENWRIPEKYVVNVNGSNNIVKKMIIFSKENNLSILSIKDKLINLIRHNHPILLNGNIPFENKRITLREYLKENLSPDDFNLFFPKEIFKKKWIFFGPNKVENITSQDNFVYEDKQSMKIRFKPIIAPEVQVESVSNAYSIQEQSEILKSWNVQQLSFPQEVFSALEVLAKKISDARVFLENYPVYSEEAEFIKDRVNHYVIELLVGYGNDFKKQEAMKKISSVSLSIDLKKELIKNLGVLQNQIQVSIDKIVGETQEHLSFEVKKMDIFLGYRFPEAVETKGKQSIDDEELFFNLKR